MTFIGSCKQEQMADFLLGTSSAAGTWWAVSKRILQVAAYPPSCRRFKITPQRTSTSCCV